VEHKQKKAHKSGGSTCGGDDNSRQKLRHASSETRCFQCNELCHFERDCPERQEHRGTVARLQGVQLVRLMRTASEVKASSGRESYLIPARLPLDRPLEGNDKPQSHRSPCSCHGCGWTTCNSHQNRWCAQDSCGSSKSDEEHDRRDHDRKCVSRPDVIGHATLRLSIGTRRTGCAVREQRVECFALADLISVRVFLVLIVKFKLFVRQGDVPAAYLKAKLQETVFVRQGQSFEDPRELHKLYGLKQAVRE
jgi:hypothetical protein